MLFIFWLCKDLISTPFGDGEGDLEVAWEEVIRFGVSSAAKGILLDPKSIVPIWGALGECIMVGCGYRSDRRELLAR